MKTLKPGRKSIDARFKVDHKDFGELQLDIELDRDNIIVLAMRKLLKTKSLAVRLFKGAISAELEPHSKIRVKAIRRLRGKAEI